MKQPEYVGLKSVRFKVPTPLNTTLPPSSLAVTTTAALAARGAMKESELMPREAAM